MDAGGLGLESANPYLVVRTENIYSIRSEELFIMQCFDVTTKRI